MDDMVLTREMVRALEAFYDYCYRERDCAIISRNDIAEENARNAMRHLEDFANKFNGTFCEEYFFNGHFRLVVKR